MSNETLHSKAMELSPSDKLQLIEDLWDSLSTHPADVPLTEAQADELDRRVADHQRDPNNVIPWEQVRRELLEDE